MQTYYTPVPFWRRKSDSDPQSPPPLSISPNRPVYSSGMNGDSPMSSFSNSNNNNLGGSPRTPSHSLPPVSEDTPLGPGPGIFESTGSRAPLIRDFQRNYPQGITTSSEHGGTINTNTNTNTASSLSFVFVDDEPIEIDKPALPSIPEKQQSMPMQIPPPGVHDKYVSQFLSPLDSSSSSSSGRPPPLMRSSSAPGVPQATATSTLLPSPLGDESQALETNQEGKPIFDIFDAQLSGGAEGMVKALKGHLESVLKMQEDVGKMHLKLESLGPVKKDDTEASDGVDEMDPLARREKGVEDIMAKLGSLSEQLRTYHALGTPKLSFPGNQATSNPLKKRTQSVDPAILAHSRDQNHSSAQHQPQSAVPHPPNHSTGISSSPERTIPRSQSNLEETIDTFDTSHLTRSHTGIHSTSNNNNNRTKTHKPSPLTLEKDRDKGRGRDLVRQASKRSLAQAWDLEKGNYPGGKRDAGEEAWIDRVKDDLGGNNSGGQSSGKKERGFTSSPVEMHDRNRPW